MTGRTAISTSVRRGVVAGLLAGLLAGMFALLIAEPSIEAAIALEAAPAGHLAGGAGEEDGLARSTQHMGLVIGTTLFGAAMGVGFGVAGAWAAGRITGNAWNRSLKLGTVVVLAVVVLPALGVPPNPPGVGDPETVAARSAAYLLLAVAGLVITAAAWAAQRQAIRRGAAAHLAATAAGVGALALAMGVVWAVRVPDAVGAFPADLLWTFRLSAIGTQIIVWGALAVIHGLLMSTGEEVAAVPSVDPLAAVR